MKRFAAPIIFLALLSAPSVRAEDVFDRLWRATLDRSPGMKAESAEVEAAENARANADRHWLPRLGLLANAVSTNSPTTTLFSTLGSRSLQASDLSPGAMNEPGRQWFKNGNLTLDLPLFEGGARVAASRGAELMQRSHETARDAKRNELFAGTVRAYAGLLAMNEERTMLDSLRTKLRGVIGRYRVGSKNNPVGHSGLLGMRALLNRIESALDANGVEKEAELEALRVRSDLRDLSEKDFPGGEAIRFARGKLETKSGEGADLRAAAERSAALAMTEYAKAERARWLPRVGLFASEGLVAGPRDTGTSTEYGAYLQWQLFDGANLGAYREASLRARAMEARVDEMNENTRIGRAVSERSLPVSLANLERIEDSLRLTAEQTEATENLFRNGSVNALQFSEVLARRADLIQAKREIEKSVLNTLVESYLMNRGQDEAAR
ncbi:MAG: TolC family protein [Bdellovibrionales bacterium]|nr:TolC family protein [Bdellovibrionales bacterium]